MTAQFTRRAAEAQPVDASVVATTPSVPATTTTLSSVPTVASDPAADEVARIRKERAEALEKIKLEIAGAAQLDAAEMTRLMTAISMSLNASSASSHDEILSTFLKSDFFSRESVPMQQTLQSIQRQFSNNGNAEMEQFAALNKVIDKANAASAASKFTGVQAAKSHQDGPSPEDFAPYTDLSVNRPPQQITAAAVAMSYMGRAITKAFTVAKNIPGKGFTDVQAGGDGLGLNAASHEPSHLADAAIQRMSSRADTLSRLKADADPSELDRAKRDFLDSTGDAERYMVNERRALMAKMAEGKANEFQTSDSVRQRNDQFESVLKQVDASEAAKKDPELKSKLKELADQASETIQNVMDSIRKLADKLLTVGDDRKSAPTGP